MPVMRRILAVMAKAPIPGGVKTRLCPLLGSEGAARLHECFVLDAVEKASSVPNAEVVVAYTPRGTLPLFRGAAPDLGRYFLQRGRNLGERMSYCFERLCGPGRAVVVMGADSPTLPARCLELAFDVLATGSADAVFGPASDGGYYLIGLLSAQPELFQGIAWGTSSVLDASLSRAKELGLRSRLLPEWYDVDRPADLACLKTELLDRSVPNRSARHTREFLRTLADSGVI